MGDMPNDFWSGWIATLTLVSLFGLAWLTFSVYFSKREDEEEVEPVWDGNLREGSNPAPIWWFWLLFSSLIFSVVYLMLYPGLGSFQGALKWSQGGRITENLERYDDEFGSVRRLIASGDLQTLQQDDDVMRSAQRVFDRNCAVCHGYDAQGQASLFPDLTDGEWQWGGSPEQIEQSIRGGRTAIMVGWQQVLGDAGVDNIMGYLDVIGTSVGEGHPGQAPYNQSCVACHGADGKGNALLGAPDLTDDIWLYGGNQDAIRHSIAIGRTGEMPAFGDRLDDAQVRLLVALLTGPDSGD